MFFVRLFLLLYRRALRVDLHRGVIRPLCSIQPVPQNNHSSNEQGGEFARAISLVRSGPKSLPHTHRGRGASWEEERRGASDRRVAGITLLAMQSDESARQDWARKQVRTVTHEMLTDRGYGELKFRATDDQLERIFKRGGTLLQCRNADAECRVVVMATKIGVKVTRALEEEYNNGETSHLVIVAAHKPTPPAQKHLLTTSMMRWCSVFPMHQVIRNVTKHEWVPRHTKLREEEVKALLDKWRVPDISKLPIMLTTDVVARYMGLLENDVVRIEGCDGSRVGTQIQYRRVLSPP